VLCGNRRDEDDEDEVSTRARERKRASRVERKAKKAKKAVSLAVGRLVGHLWGAIIKSIINYWRIIL